ncbi:MAG: YHS domain-containing (seleno)protein [Pseudomonadota bacterium]
MKRLLAATLISITALGTSAFAGPQFIDNTGFAVSGYDVVAYFDLEQAPIGQSQPLAIPGNATITADYNGSTFAFSTEANRDTFLADPAKYAPQYDGHCAYGVAVGGKVPANPNLWRIVDGKLFLNINTDVVSRWEKDVPGFVVKADDEWTGLEAAAASTARIPSFKSEAPVTN